MSVEVVAAPSRALADLDLDELGAVARREAEEAGAAAQTALGHAIRAGEALLEARRRIEPGKWSAWLLENFPWTAFRYMRIAEYQREIPAHVDSIAAADRYIAAQPRLDRRPLKRSSEVQARVQQARHLIELGASQTQVAQELGVSGATVSRWLNPDRDAAIRARERARAAEQRRARLLLQQKRRDDAVRTTGGSLAHVYAGIRRTVQDADRALESADSRDVKRALDSVITRLHGAEDRIVEALGLDRAHPRKAEPHV